MSISKIDQIISLASTYVLISKGVITLSNDLNTSRRYINQARKLMEEVKRIQRKEDQTLRLVNHQEELLINEYRESRKEDIVKVQQNVAYKAYKVA